MSFEPLTVPLTLEDITCRFELEVSETEVSFDGSVEQSINFDPHPVYTGATSVNPGPNAVTLQTAGKILNANIVIQPVSSRWGRISWNGSYLTVS